MKAVSLLLISLGLVGCMHSQKQPNSLHTDDFNPTVADSLLYVSTDTLDSTSFITLKMNPSTAYITMADSIIPAETDSTIALCVEAAFTGELLREFKSSNVAGDYVIDGNFHRGYKCTANTGFLYADKSIFTISSLEYCADWIKKAQMNNGCLFQQILLMKNGKNVYKRTPIKPTASNVYRSACIMNDGNFVVIQSKNPLPLTNFIESLIAMGVSDALYLDMGKGWNYGWYRETSDSKAMKLFDHRTPYQTNWLVIKSK